MDLLRRSEMTRLPLVALVAAVAACGGRSAPQNTSAPSPITSNRPPIQIKVMSFNIQHGMDGSSKYNLQRAIATIARVQPDIVGLQEVTTNHPYYACDDQPARIAAGVSAATGMQWTVVYEQEWFTPDVSCQASGRGSGRETEGLAFLAKRSMSGSVMTPLPDSRIGLETSVRDAYALPVVVTHLTSGSGKGAMRSQQVDRLLGWAEGFGQPRIVLGDFNAQPESAELQRLFASYHDAWNDAVAMGRAIGSGLSHKGGRIDYIFYLPGGAMTLDSAEVVDTTSFLGVAASDHAPVVATFTIR
jgi:endonuclease/exonuclease/phosphatase family metal-dependent hydrolase